MKLKVYQQGGGLIYTPFIPGRTESRISGSSGNSSEDGPKIDPLDKEILALMKDQNLLPSDIQAIFNSLTAFQRKTQHLSTAGLGTDAYRSVMPGMLQITKMVSIARANKDQWDKSVAEVKSHDAGSEVALDGYGRMWVMDKEGKLSKINPKDFDSEKYAPVSNSQLLFYRQRNNDLAFSDDIFGETGMDVIGMKDIRTELDDMISKLGSIKTSDFRVQKLSDIAKDLQGVGIFKLMQKYDKGDLQDFASLLYSRLSNEAKHLIDANSALGGYNKHDYILSIIRSETSSEVTSDYDANLSKAGGVGGDGSDAEKLNDKDTYAERLATGEGVVGQWDYLMAGNSGHKLYAYYQDYGTPMADGNSMKTMSMERFLENFDASGDINWSKATFGDYKIKPEVDLAKIMYKGGSTIKRVWLPVTEDGTVDFNAQQEMATLQNWINDNGIINETLIRERVSEIKNAYWDENEKTIKFKNSKPFLVVDVITSSDKVRFDPNSPYVYNMDRGPADLRREYLDRYESVLENGYPEHSKNKDYDFGKTRGRHLYEGLLFLPITHETIGTTIYHAQNVPKTRYVDVRNQAELKEKKQNLIGNYGG